MLRTGSRRSIGWFESWTSSWWTARPQPRCCSAASWIPRCSGLEISPRSSSRKTRTFWRSDMVPRLASVLALVATAMASQEAAKFSYLVGSAQVRRGGKSIPARVSFACQVGDTVVLSKASRAELRYPDNTLLRLEENSKAVLTPRAKGGPEPTLLGGKAWANVKKIGQGGTGFGVRTPTAVAAVRGTVFRVSDADSSSNVRLYEGKVDVGSIRSDSAARARGEVAGPKEVSLENWGGLLKGE